jgi:hypothetical protein
MEVSPKTKNGNLEMPVLGIYIKGYNPRYNRIT